MKYKVGDTVIISSFDQMDEILENYEAEWVCIGKIMITKVKESEDGSN